MGKVQECQSFGVPNEMRSLVGPVARFFALGWHTCVALYFLLF